METKKCKIHGIFPLTAEYFYFNNKVDNRNRNKSGNRTCPPRYYTQIRCKKCVKESGAKILQNNINNLNETYLRKTIKNNIIKITGLKHKEINISKELIDVWKTSILIERAFKYELDGQNFTCLRHLSIYVQNHYNINSDTFEYRIKKGYSIKESLNFTLYDKRFKTNQKIAI